MNLNKKVILSFLVSSLGGIILCGQTCHGGDLEDNAIAIQVLADEPVSSRIFADSVALPSELESLLNKPIKPSYFCMKYPSGIAGCPTVKKIVAEKPINEVDTLDATVKVEGSNDITVNTLTR